MTQRLLLASIIFVELGLAALSAIAFLHGRFDQGPAFFVYVFGALGALALASGFALPVDVMRRAGTHGLLMLGCVLFALPFVWLVSTSFKYEEEVFVHPPKWVPSVPQVVLRSPYLTDEELPPIERPPDVANDRWTLLWPKLEAVVWDRGRRLIGDERATGFPETQLRAFLVRGIWSGLSARVAIDAWQTDELAIAAVAGRIDAEVVETAWEVIHRGVTVRPPTVTDDQLVTQQVILARDTTGGEWTPLGGDARCVTTQSPSGKPTFTDISYDLTDANTATIAGEFALPFPVGKLFSVTLPLRPDRSWHELRVALETSGRRYVLEDRLYLGQRRWQEFTFKFKHLDSRDERDIGTFPLIPTEDATGTLVDDGRFRIVLTLVKAGGPAAMWRKFTSSYAAAYLATEHRWSYIANSAYLVVLSVVGQLISCSMVAYAFARLRWPGRELAFVVLLATLMLPAQVTMVPVFIVFKHLDWYNTLKALWVPSFFGSAFFIFMLRQFMKSIPVELEEAARIDGCSVFGIYWRIILPLVRPALAAVAIFTFMNTWNDFMGPLIYINDQRLYPLSLGLFEFRTEHGTDYGMLMAASTLMTLPVILIFFLAQRYFIEGVTLTGMKA